MDFEEIEALFYDALQKSDDMEQACEHLRSLGVTEEDIDELIDDYIDCY